MIWDRLMALFCRGFGHAIECDDGDRYCVRCGLVFHHDWNGSPDTVTIVIDGKSSQHKILDMWVRAAESEGWYWR